MTHLLTVLAISVALCGVAFILYGSLTAPAPRSDTTPARMRVVDRARGLVRGMSRQRGRLVAGVVVGIATWLISGWPVALVAVPAGFLFLPEVLVKPSTRGLTLTEALAAWTRNIAALVQTGTLGVEDVIQLSLPATAENIRPTVATLVSRFRGGWDTQDALRAFADDLADPAADKVTAHLIQAARKRAGDLPRALDALAEEMAAEARVRRAIEADRAKPRQSLRIVTLITVGVVLVLPLFGRSGQFAGYATPIGQAMLAFWIACYIGLLLWVRAILRESPPSRLFASKEPDR
ncbi:MULTISPECIES: type II secretion system F family protein [unclassified Microbacterium]|uniref:type II secretion system F family protein n=1 Tax=unclassified Microbacterium TaxID=2609290 RepID=UPI000C2C2AB8|nr:MULTISPECIES: type II secretion system F family protein [unclassified Microbacterium]